MQFSTVSLPEGVRERKLLQLRYPLLTSPSKALVRGHYEGEGGSILSTMQETFSTPLLLNINVALLGPHYSYSFPEFLLLYHFLLTHLRLLYASVLHKAHLFLPVAPPLLSTKSSLASSLPMNLFLFERFRWHLNSSHRFPYGRGFRDSSLKELKSTI